MVYHLLQVLPAMNLRIGRVGPSYNKPIIRIFFARVKMISSAHKMAEGLFFLWHRVYYLV